MSYKGIDVSHWQGKNINWQAVKNSGVEAVICRAGVTWYGPGMDSDDTFPINASQLQGFLPFGAYYYSMAENADDAAKEANFFIDQISDYKLTMPVYIDLEEEVSKKNANEIAEAFIAVCEKAGYRCGIYAGRSYIEECIDLNRFRNKPLWLAWYKEGSNTFYPDYFGVWQYSDKGSIPGIFGDVDMNEVYKNYWEGMFEQVTEIPKKNISLEAWGTIFIQYWMVTCNYRPFAPIDALPGCETNEGVRTGQRAYGIEADGIFGTITQSMATGQVLAYQKRLKELGFYHAALDGIPGEIFFDAIKCFQRSRGLDIDGVIGNSTYSSLIGRTPTQPEKPQNDLSDDTQLSDDFRRFEFKCECQSLGLNYCSGYPVEPHPTLIRVLQRLANKIGKPIFITSGIRCQSYNDSLVGSIPNSIHLSGGAADFAFDGIDTWAIVDWANAQPEVDYSYTNDSYMYGAVHIQVYM